MVRASFHLQTLPRHVGRRIAAALGAATLVAGLVVVPVARAATPFAAGDVMAGVGNGSVKQFDPTGTLKNTLVGTSSTYTTGMAFDSAGNLYVTDFGGGSVDKYDTNGNFLGAFISGITGNPESLAFDAAGNLYVGRADGPDVQKYDSTGAFVTSFAITPDLRGSDWIDLAADQCTLFYTSEGTLIKRFNVCTNTQLSDFATLPQGEAYALRIRPNGDVIVADTSVAYRLDSTGALVQTYTIPGASLLFGMNLDPDGTSFWTGDINSGDINRIDIATGAVLTTFSSSPLTFLAGLAVVGEIRAASPAHLTISKIVNNSAGGSATSGDWTLSASGPTPISGPGGATGDVSAGTYTLTESAGPANYSPGTWQCTGVTPSGNSITLAADQTASCSITNTFVPFLSHGAFAIGDQNAVVGATVTWWAPDWWKANSLTGGSAPASFKGFATTVSPNPPIVGGTWTTGPGSSPQPPSTVPAYMAVIVTSSVSKSGSTISGNIVHIVLVKTGAAYGTGTVVAILS